jgi:DNA-directed RNA polymerase specialized sigma24 family protein
MPKLRRRWKGASTQKEVMEYKNSDIEKVIDEYIHSERDRAILKRRYIDGICYEPLAEEFDLSTRQIKNIIYKHENLLFGMIAR